MGWAGATRRMLAGAVVAASVLLLSACTATVSISLGDDAAAVSTNLDDFTFDSLDVDYTLTRADDGTSRLEVVETFVAVFPEYDQNRGMRRSIPDSYQGVPLDPQLVSITDETGAPRAAETDSEDGVFSMTSRADDYVHGAQTYVFTYTLENVTRYFADTGDDEFYWDVNGDEWAQPFGRVTATLHLAPELAAALTGDQACYRGYFGASETCDIAVTDAAAGGAEVVASTTGLSAYQTMTIAVGFEKGTFAAFDSSYLASPWGWLQAVSGVGVLAGLAWAIVFRRRTLRDAPGRPTIIAEYTPPAHIDALESAVLLQKQTKAIPAEVLEQAVVGSIRIVEGERRWFGRVPLKAELVDPSRADGDGRMLLDGLFPTGMPGEEFEFGRSDRRFSSAAQAILKAAGSELVRRGLLRTVSPWRRAVPVLVTTIAGVAVFLTGFAALDGAVNALVPLLVIGAAVAAEFVVFALVSHKPLTALGAEVRDHLAGLREFIEWAEADRIRMLQSPQGAERAPVYREPGRPGEAGRPPVDTTDPRQMLVLYETLLPYAVVFGQERQWAAQLAVLYGSDGSPSWYSGSSGFNAAAFSSGIGSLSASSASSSSTSGGSGGGGSAGGGGGGGGGGGV